MWVAALSNECWIELFENKYCISAFDEVIEEVYVENIVSRQGRYKLFSHFDKTIESVRQYSLRNYVK